MKILCVGDVHWSQNSSIVRSRGSQYSTRLENLIQSVNWAEETGWNTGCNVAVYMGDFFDSAVLNNEEISALREIRWSPIPHIFITGNHETNVSSLEYSTCDIFNLCPNSTVISKPEYYHIEGTDVEFAFLPYILEKDRQPVESYFPQKSEKRIIFSHNDLKDVQYGAFLSTEGFTIDELESNSDLCMNGHIHHCAYVTNKIINVGNLTGQNFTEDATKYGHFVEVVDTTDLGNIQFYRNPYAFNFLKKDVTTCNDSDLQFNLKPPCDYAVMTVKATVTQAAKARLLLDSFPKERLVSYRLVIESDNSAVEVTNTEFEAVDHLKQFEQYVLQNIGDNNIIREELTNVMR